MSYYTYYTSPVGRLLLECNDVALTGLWIQNQKYYAAGADVDMHTNDTHHVFNIARQWLDIYFAGRVPDATPPVAPRGTDFQKRVWRALGAIPYSQTATYGDLASELGSAPRAVGAAIGRNPISIIIPCHRVVGKNHCLTGYAGGLDIKKQLLQIEANAAQ